MRLRRLELIAFGPFTEHVLDFSGGSPGGLHVVYGPNEAGKSTALRAVSGLLFGIPDRTQDAHLHAPAEVRVGGTIEAASGETLAIIRRKKRKDSLRDAQDAPIDEARLRRMLGGVGRELFQSLFGLDHQALRVGGEALLAGKGDVGESLFDAGLGGGSIRGVLASLRREAEELFKPRGQNPKLNVALDGYKDAVRRGREAVLLPKAWFEQQQELDAKLAERSRLEAERRTLYRERDGKKRLLNLLKPVGRRRQLLEDRRELGPVLPLPKDATERRESAERTLLESARDIDRLERTGAKKTEGCSALVVSEFLLDLEAGFVDELAEGIPLYRKGVHELPALRATIAACEDDARAKMRKLGRAPSVKDAESLRLSSADQERIRDLERQHALLDERLERAKQRLRLDERTVQLKELERARLGLPQDLSRVKGAFTRARAALNLDERIEALETERLKSAAELEHKFKALAVQKLRPDELFDAAIPSAEWLEKVELEWRELEQRSRRLREADDRQRLRRTELERQIRTIERAGPVPSVQARDSARARRDEGWQLVRRAWQTGNAAEDALRYDPERPLAEAFERSIAAADDVADQLWGEAARLADLSAARLALEDLEAPSDLEQAERRSVDQGIMAIEQRWQVLWSGLGIDALSPAEMRSWLARHSDFRAQFEQNSLLEVELRALHTHRRKLCDELRAVLSIVQQADAACRDSLSELLEVAQERLELDSEISQNRRVLNSLLDDLGARVEHGRYELADLEAEFQRWQDAWGVAIRPLELSREPSPHEAVAMLEDLRELFRRLDELPDARQRLMNLERELAEFRTELTALVREHAPDLAELPCERSAEELVKRCRDARSKAVERERLQGELSELGRELEVQREKNEAAERELSELMAALGTTDRNELERAERRARRARDLDEQLMLLEEQLREASDGATLEEILEQAAGADRATIVLELEEIEARLEETDQLRNDTIVDISRIERGLELYRSSEEAADAAQQAEVLASEIRELVERYARVRLASVVLEREILRYREKNQDPVLARAAALFPRLTLSKYVTLRVGLEEPTIVCVRNDGAEVEVNGLSEGAQYQLYLALRLATLEHYLESAEPMPLVFDDVLLHFDDERARAAFEILGELAERLQILFFTHHYRHVELAREAGHAPRLFVHELENATHRPGERAHL